MNSRGRLIGMIVAVVPVLGLAQDSAERYAKVVGRMVEAINAGDYPGTLRDFSKIMLDGTGIKCLFDKVSLTRGGKTSFERRCSPIKGDIVEQR